MAIITLNNRSDTASADQVWKARIKSIKDANPKE